jgi:hypothetical protein
MKTNISLWIPAVFAAFLSGMVLYFLPLDAAVWRPACFSFLPMCFVFVGFAMMNMRKEITELKTKIELLENKKG